MIHPTAIIGPGVCLGEGVTVGPYAVLEGDLEIGAGTRVDAHAVLRNACAIGRNCRVGCHVVIGGDPQHRTLAGGPTWVVIGDNVDLREGASVHRSTRAGRAHATRIGDDCFLMSNAHVAHDCTLGLRVTMASGAMLGGHCDIGDDAFLGGGCGIHQHCRVGRLAIVAALELITHDVPPFAAVRNGGMKAYNAVGCRRGGLSPGACHALRRAYHALHAHRNRSIALGAIRDLDLNSAECAELVDFITVSRRGIVRSTRSGSGGGGECTADLPPRVAAGALQSIVG